MVTQFSMPLIRNSRITHLTQDLAAVGKLREKNITINKQLSSNIFKTFSPFIIFVKLFSLQKF